MENFPRVDDLLKDQNPKDVAVIHNHKRYTYGDISDGMMQVAANLQFHQVYLDKIIVLLGNRPEAIMAIMGISYIGGTFIPVPNTIKAERLAEIVNDSGATTIITDEAHFKVTDAMEPIGSVDDPTPTLRAVLDVDNLVEFRGVHLCQSKPTYPAALMYTSGTTGKPKGVICPHHKIMAAVSSINAYMMHTKDDIVVSALPLSHGYGLYQVFTVFDAGGTVILEDNFAYPQKTLDAIQVYKATGFAAVPSMIHMMMQVDGWDLLCGELSYITTAGAALPDVTFKKLVETLPTVDIIPMYGQTECVRALAYPKAIQDKNRLTYTSCGVPIPDTGTSVIVDHISDVSVKGELIIHSPHVMDGYWNNPEETKKAFENGFLHTGDIFAIDENGLHYYIGRDDDVIKIKGEKCSPVELDNALLKLPGVIEAAAFSVDDKIWGNRFILYVATNDAFFNKNDVMRFCKQHLESHMMPKDVVIMGKIPKNDNGKISRPLLKKDYLNRGNVK